MDASVSPVRVLAGQPNGQPPELWVDGWPSSRFVRWLCPVSDYPSSMPAQHGVWFDDQKRFALPRPGHRRSKEGEDGSVEVSEVWSVDLALQHQDLAAQSEDLGVTVVAGGEYPSESVDNKANQSRKQGHERTRLLPRSMLKTRVITGWMNLRHAHAQKPVLLSCS